MYAGRGFRTSQIGDVDVVKHDGLYHLFHLSLPNHSVIAHAVSRDGLTWKRVRNAIFVSDPEAWDDDMLWTMHVSPNPYHPGEWRMFYTGLKISENGRIQRVGLARSTDLYTWHKDTSGKYPLEIPGPAYESRLDEGRHWVSFRDPFYFRENNRGFLFAAGRVNRGPVIRRGCVAMAEETEESRFAFREPLFSPMHYDDIEVPNVVKLNGHYYLLGSIREDIKIHYWHADALEGPYRNFHDNVLLPQGNYSGRVSQDGDRWLIWNFFFKGLTTKGDHLLAPPKQLSVDSHGALYLESFHGFDNLVEETRRLGDLGHPGMLFENPHAHGKVEANSCWAGCSSGFEAFLLPGRCDNFRFSGQFKLQGFGKCGLVLRLDEKGDGYYLSLDLFKGIAQIRAWRQQEDPDLENAFHYQQLQAAHFVPMGIEVVFSMLAHEQYLEFSLNGRVLLTLADDQFKSGKIGFYVESAEIRIDDLKVEVLSTPETPASSPSE